MPTSFMSDSSISSFDSDIEAEVDGPDGDFSVAGSAGGGGGRLGVALKTGSPVLMVDPAKC